MNIGDVSQPGLLEIRRALDAVCARMRDEEDRGQVAAYIPELSRADPAKFGIAASLASGEMLGAGDAGEPLTIQSVSKVFALALALGKKGDALWRRVGREPSGLAFDSILQLEHEKGVPRNPFINAGAIVTTDAILAGHQPKETLGEILRFVRFLADDDDIHFDREVAASEAATGHRNRALANYLKSCGNLENPVELTLGVYFHQCAIAMTCRQLAQAGRFLAFGGRLKPGGSRIIAPGQARRINSIMLTCGHYNGSGEFAFRVGLPGKSGVSGAILAIVPGVASIAVWSPGLDANGNSLLGTRALERIVNELGWYIFQ
ncbi:MAG TPA: glutaminase [Thermohalobaculum sp.]|nr:glutaminase [Thermohalobaculum sp.]